MLSNQAVYQFSSRSNFAALALRHIRFGDAPGWRVDSMPRKICDLSAGVSGHSRSEPEFDYPDEFRPHLIDRDRRSDQGGIKIEAVNFQPLSHPAEV